LPKTNSLGPKIIKLAQWKKISIKSQLYLSLSSTFIIQVYYRYLLFFLVGSGIGKFSIGNEIVHYWQQIGLLKTYYISHLGLRGYRLLVLAYAFCIHVTFFNTLLKHFLLILNDAEPETA